MYYVNLDIYNFLVICCFNILEYIKYIVVNCNLSIFLLGSGYSNGIFDSLRGL